MLGAAIRTAIPTVLLVAALASPAGAARVEVVREGGVVPPQVEFNAGVGEANVLAVRYEGVAFVFDDVVAVAPGSGCEQGADATIVECYSRPDTPLRIDLGDRSDRYTATPGASLGPRAIAYPSTAVRARTRVEGGTGDDTIGGGLGPDVLRGGKGSDMLAGPTPDGGADELLGGLDSDTAVAVGRNAAGPVSLALSLDDQPNDGAPGQPAPDNLRADIENLTSGPGNDTIVPRWFGGTVRAGEGDDTFELRNGWSYTAHGDAGNDTASYAGQTLGVSASLDGRANDGPHEPFPTGAVGNLLTIENVTGGSGSDRIEGNAGVNRLGGGDGSDQIDGHPGPDRLLGGDGDDHLVGFDQAQDQSSDRVDCGEGRDTVVFDRLDSLAADCELDYGALLPIEVEIVTQIEVFAADRSFVLPVECLIGPDCVGTVRVVALVPAVEARAIGAAATRVTIAKRGYRVRGGTSKRLRLRLTRKGRRLLRRVARRRPARRALRVQVSSTTKPPPGYRPSTARRTIRLSVKRASPSRAGGRRAGP